MNGANMKTLAYYLKHATARERNLVAVATQPVGKSRGARGISGFQAVALWYLRTQIVRF